jgi:hypothetical protein
VGHKVWRTLSFAGPGPFAGTFEVLGVACRIRGSSTKGETLRLTVPAPAADQASGTPLPHLRLDRRSGGRKGALPSRPPFWWASDRSRVRLGSPASSSWWCRAGAPNAVPPLTSAERYASTARWGGRRADFGPPVRSKVPLPARGRQSLVRRRPERGRSRVSRVCQPEESRSQDCRLRARCRVAERVVWPIGLCYSRAVP